MSIACSRSYEVGACRDDAPMCETAYHLIPLYSVPGGSPLALGCGSRRAGGCRVRGAIAPVLREETLATWHSVGEESPWDH